MIEKETQKVFDYTKHGKETWVLAIDPSGSFKHGSGTSGYAIIEKETMKIIRLGNIKAKNFKTKEIYFIEHLNLIRKWKEYALEENRNLELVVESFILYKESATTMLHQELETSELIGFLTTQMTLEGIKIIKQKANQIKGHLTKHNVLLAIVNEKEEQLTFITNKADRVQWYFEGQRISNHILDAIRHAVYYIVMERQKGKEKFI